SVAIDAQGDVGVVWVQSDGTAASIYSERYDAALGAWSGASLLETTATAAADARIGFDGAGNGLAIWRQGGDLLARRYVAATGTWAAQVIVDSRTNTIGASPSLWVDASGRAIATWIQSDGVANSTWASFYDPATNSWAAAQLLETA